MPPPDRISLPDYLDADCGLFEARGDAPLPPLRHAPSSAATATAPTTDAGRALQLRALEDQAAAELAQLRRTRSTCAPTPDPVVSCIGWDLAVDGTRWR